MSSEIDEYFETLRREVRLQNIMIFMLGAFVGLLFAVVLMVI